MPSTRQNPRRRRFVECLSSLDAIGSNALLCECRARTPAIARAFLEGAPRPALGVRSQRQLVLHALADDLREGADVAKEAERGLVAFGQSAAQLLVAGGACEVRRHERQLAADALAAGGPQKPDAHHRLLGVGRVRREGGEAADLAGVV